MTNFEKKALKEFYSKAMCINEEKIWPVTVITARNIKVPNGRVFDEGIIFLTNRALRIFIRCDYWVTCLYEDLGLDKCQWSSISDKSVTDKWRGYLTFEGTWRKRYKDIETSNLEIAPGTSIKSIYIYESPMTILKPSEQEKYIKEHGAGWFLEKMKEVTRPVISIKKATEARKNRNLKTAFEILKTAKIIPTGCILGNYHPDIICWYYNELGNCYIENHKYQDALSSFEKSLSQDKDCITSLEGKAECYKETGDTEKLNEVVKKILYLEPGSTLVPILLEDKGQGDIVENLVRDHYKIITNLEHCKLYLENIHKPLSEVENQAWLKGILNQVINKNREKLSQAGSALLEVVDVVVEILKTQIQKQARIAQLITDLSDTNKKLKKAIELVQSLRKVNDELIDLLRSKETMDNIGKTHIKNALIDILPVRKELALYYKSIGEHKEYQKEVSLMQELAA